MKSNFIKRLLRALVTMLGAGVGAGLAALAVVLMNYCGHPANLETLILSYTGACITGAVLFFILSPALISWCGEAMAALEKFADKMTIGQLSATVFGLMVGLAIAALLSQLVLLMGTSFLTVCFSAIIYVVLGCAGMRIGNHRAGDIESIWKKRFHLRTTPEKSKKLHRNKKNAVAVKLLDSSVLIDGRVLAIAKAGFLEGQLVAPSFVVSEMQRLADSVDPLRRGRGRRGLDMLKTMQDELGERVYIIDKDYADTDQADVKLLHMAQENGYVLVTNDYNLNKAATVSGVTVQNINELVNAVRPVVQAGEDMTVQIMKEGKEPGQGVAYLEDGTMIVVENARSMVGETVEVTVTSVLQTAAGRMIFAHLKSFEAARAIG